MYLEKIQNRRAKGNGGRKYPFGDQYLTPEEIEKEAGSPFSSVRYQMTRYGLSIVDAVNKLKAKNARN